VSKKKDAKLAFQPAPTPEAPAEGASEPYVIDAGWTCEVVWFCPNYGTVGVRYKLNGKLLFCTQLRKELLEAVRGGWEGMDKICWVQLPPLGWSSQREGQASEEAVPPKPKKGAE
jgi:hypothetical protein